MARYVSMITLVDSKISQNLVWSLVSGCAAFSLPKGGSDVVRLAQHGAFSDIVGFAYGLEMKEPSC